MEGNTIRTIILNEVERGRRLDQETVPLGSSPAEAAKLLARYDRQIKSMDEEKTAEHLKAYLERMYPELPVGSSIWRSLPAYARYGLQIPLSEIREVPIFREELDEIDALGTRAQRCFAFACLAVSRYEILRNGGKDAGRISGKRWGEIERRANLSLGRRGRYQVLFQLREAGYLAFGAGVTNLSAGIPGRRENGEIALRLSTPDFEDLGWRYREHTGEPFSRCLECGRLIRRPKTGRPRKYCPDCSPAVRREYWADRKRAERK